MPGHDLDELNHGRDLPELASTKAALTIAASSGNPLSPAQLQFNKRMKALEKARATHERERSRLDGDLRICCAQLMPLVEMLKRAELDLILAAYESHQAMKLTPKRHKWLGDLISGKVSDLLADPAGLSDGEVDRLEALIGELGPSLIDQQRKEMERMEFDELRILLEEMARQAGVELDLSDLDLDGDPIEGKRRMLERLAAVRHEFQNATNGAAAPDKSSKAGGESERMQRETEAAKTRDFKSLYKQLAKVLHPDLEIDPTLKAHKEDWMKRLTTAYANGDLRDMLAIEMEWLGEETGNLTKASDEKLRVYAMFLKEQLDALKEQTRLLIREPQYHLLSRFLPSFGARLNSRQVQSDLSDEISRLKQMIARLSVGGKDALMLVHQWADAHARDYSRGFA